MTFGSRRRRASGLSMSAGVVVLLSTAVAGAEWKELGPAPLGGTNGNAGRITGIAAHPTDNNLFYVTAATGGVWKNQNGTWTPLTDKMPFNAMGAIAIDPNDGKTLYAGTGEGDACYHCFYGIGIFKTTDGGATWTQLAASTFGGRAFSRILVSPMNSQLLYASIASTGDQYGVGAKGHPGASGPKGVFRSTDGGVTWSQLTGGLPSLDTLDLAFAPGTPSTLYATVAAHSQNSANGIYKSTNGGESWAKLAGGLPAIPGRIGIGIAPSDPNRIYALIAQPEGSATEGQTMGIYTSRNAGMTWTATPGVQNFMGQQGMYNNVVIVDPKDPDVAFFGGVNVKKTSNGGTSITDVTAQHVDNHAFAFTAGGDLLIGQDGGVCRSAGGSGTNWVRMNQGLGINQLYAGVTIHPTDAQYVLGGFQDNGTNVRRGTTGTWGSVLGGDGGYTAIIKSAPNIQFATIYDAGSLYRSTNGGTSFPNSSTGISTSDRTAFYHVTVPNPADPNVVFTATHRIYKSTNQGASWTSISGDLTGGGENAIRALSVSQNGMVLWAATTDNRIMMSQNGGMTFTKKLDVPGGWQRVTRELVAAPWDANTAYVAVQRFGADQVRMTKDLGTTWTAIDGNLPDVPVNTVDAAVVQEKQMVFIGTDAGVYYTCNDGGKWVRLGTALPNTVVSDIRYDGAFKRVVASTMGRGVWSIEEPSAASCEGGTTGTGGTGVGSGGAGGGAGGRGGGGVGGVGGGQGGRAGTGGAAGGNGATGGRTGSGGEGGGGVGSGGATGSGGADGSGGSVGTGGGNGSGGTSGGTGGGNGTSGSGGRKGGTDGSGDDGGCGCNVAVGNGGSAIALVALGIVLALRRRRRRGVD